MLYDSELLVLTNNRQQKESVPITMETRMQDEFGLGSQTMTNNVNWHPNTGSQEVWYYRNIGRIVTVVIVFDGVKTIRNDLKVIC